MVSRKGETLRQEHLEKDRGLKTGRPGTEGACGLKRRELCQTTDQEAGKRM